MKKYYILALTIVLLLNSVFASTCAYGCNTPPTTPSVQIVPAQPDEKDELYCYAQSTDAEGDPITYIYKWYKNGVLFRTYTTRSTYTVISSAYTKVGDKWKCKVRAYDGKEYSDYSYDSVTIRESLYGCDTFNMEVPVSTLTVNPGEEKTVSILLRNEKPETNCITLSASTSDPKIDAWFASTSVCIEPKETKYVQLHIRAPYTVGKYYIKLKARNSCITRYDKLYVNVKKCVGRCPSYKGIFLEAEKIDVCKNNAGYVSVLLRNNTSKCLTVKLGVNSNTLAASFEDDTVQLCSYEQTHVNLKVFAGNVSGKKCFNIYAYGICTNCENYYATETVCVNVKECRPEYGTSVALILPEQCIDIKKNETKNIQFKVKNLLCEVQKVRLETAGNISTNTEDRITLMPEEERDSYIKVFAGENVRPGKHYIKVYAISEKGRDKKELCVNVLPLRKVRIELSDPSKVIEQCSFSVYTMKIINEGDVTEKFCLSAGNSSGAKITFSEKCLEVSPKETKEVFITVNVPKEMSPGSYSADIIIEDGNVWKKTIYFEVVEEGALGVETPQPGEVPEEYIPVRPLRILSYPEAVTIQRGEARTLNVVVYNVSPEPIEADVVIEIEGITKVTKTFVAQPNEATEVAIELEVPYEVKEGKYKAYIQIISRVVQDVKEMEIDIKGVTFPVGLAPGASAILIAVILLIAFVIILLIIKKAIESNHGGVLLKRR